MQKGARIGALTVAAIATLIGGRALAEPRGGEVISGGAVTVTPDGNHTHIETTTEQTRMRWDGFDIAVDESVHVQQPTVGSTLVNHVNDASITTIDGALSSNGRVWILNPAGVYFGGTAIVEVAGLVAAAGTITDQAYVIGARHFSGMRGEVHVGEGATIRAGHAGVALIGRAVENHGQIVTQGGDIVLAAGDDVLLMRHDTFIQVHMKGFGADAERPSVLNSGRLEARTGRVRLAAGDFLGLAIRNQGEIYAQNIEIEAGAQSLVEIAGTLDASNAAPGGQGGHVEVTGDFVVIDDAQIDASGEAGGGEIWLGGEASGQGELENARGVFVSEGSEIRADANGEGDGGEIVVWGDEIARVQGSLSARGGPVGGDGGFIETSSKGRLSVDADIDTSASSGHPGTWLLDPVNISIMDDVSMGTLIEPVFDPDLGFTIAQPDGAAPDSVVSTTAIVNALERGGAVVVTTQSSNLADPGTDDGWIKVEDSILVTDGTAVAPNTTAELALLAAGDIEINAPIVSDEPDLALSVSLFANDNPLLAGAGGQSEPLDKQRFGDVDINADIVTQGGSVVARGTNVTVNAGVNIDTTSADPDADGGFVDFVALDVVETGQLPGTPDDMNLYGNVAVEDGVSITTSGGLFSSRGENFTMRDTASINALRQSAPGIRLGAVLMSHSKQLELLGDVTAETIFLGSGSAGIAGQGNIILGANTTLSATEINLNAGDGAGGAGSDARVVVDPLTTFAAADPLAMSPERFFLTQDAPIRSSELPTASQFAGGVMDMSFLLSTLDGDPGSGDDILLDDVDNSMRFSGTDLVLSAPDSIGITSKTGADNLTLLIEEGFTVSAAMAPNLELTPMDPDDGLLIIHAARGGTGHLELEDGAILTAPTVALRAGDTAIGVGSGTTSTVIIPDTATFDTASFEVRQDADLSTDDLPDATQFMPGLADMQYTIISDSGSVTISDAAKVADTRLTLVAIQDIDDDIVLDVDIEVRTGDFGGLTSFLVTSDLLDRITFSEDLMGNPLGPRILTLRAVEGILSFDTQELQPGVSEPLSVEADRIRLIGSTINVATNTPQFQTPEATAPESFIFQQTAQLGDSALPTEDNFPQGGPTDLFAIQSLASIALTQQSDPGSARGWTFPVGDNARVILSAPFVSLLRPDGADLVLDSRDDIWGTSVILQAIYDPGQGPAPIQDPSVDADDLNSILGFDFAVDFTGDPTSIVPPEDAVGRLEIDQDATFALQGNENDDGLPDFLRPQDGFLPSEYRLVSLNGSIEVENDRFEDATHNDLQLELVVVALDQFIDFEGTDSLDVRVLGAEMPGRFRVGQDTNGSDGAIINASELILLSAGTDQAGLLSFTAGVELTTEQLTLQAGLDGRQASVVDARTNDPMFAVDEFELLQGGAIINGLGAFGGLEFAELLPLPGQFGPRPIERYRLQSLSGDIEINNPDEVLIGRTVELFAGSSGSPTTLTLRANAPMSDLVLIDATTGVEAVRMVARKISLEAPDGFVDAGDPRVTLDASGASASIAIRQSDRIRVDQADRLPENRQLVGDANAPYSIQSVVGVELGEALAERVTGNNLILIAGVPQEDFDDAFGSSRHQDPDPNFPDAEYDRFSDLNNDGFVDMADETLLGMLTPAAVKMIAENSPMFPFDPIPFDLVLASLSIRSNPGDGAPIELGSVHIKTESDQTYSDEITLTGDTELTARAGQLFPLSPTVTARASSITFEHAIDGFAAGANALTVNATDRVHFMESIGAGVRLGKLEINLEQILQLQNPPPTPRVEFGTLESAEEFLEANGFVEPFYVMADTILLNPQAGNSASDFVRSRVPDFATFFRLGGDLIFDLGDATTPGKFVMGENEKLTVDGPELRIDAHGGNVTVGDLSALDLIDVDAGNIYIQRRDKGSVVRANGERIDDNGVDFVARDIRFVFDGSTGPDAGEILHRNQTGSGKDARFGIADPANAPGFMSDFSVLALQYNILTGGAVPIDGVPDGLSRAELARVFTDPRPDVPIAVPAAQRIRQPDALEVIGVSLREPTGEELRDAARGAGVYRDLGSMDARGDIRVSESRLVATEVEETARLYVTVFGENGESTPRIREVLQSAIDDYKRSTGARRVVGFELRRYVYNRPSSQFHAYQQLQNLDSLFRHHRRSGLTRSEYGAIQGRWLEAIRPEGITVHELSEFIHPSRYVRGRDVLDVFSD